MLGECHEFQMEFVIRNDFWYDDRSVRGQGKFFVAARWIHGDRFVLIVLLDGTAFRQRW